MNSILILLAIIPAVFLMVMVYKKDRIEKEPVRLLISLLIFGALSCFPASILENLFDPTGLRGTLYSFVLYFLVVGVSEELCKYFMLRIRTWKSKEFNCSFDGIVYAVFTSLGFAALENIMYVTGYGVGNAIIRAFTAIPGHACFGLIMGYYYGNARKYANLGNKAKEKSETRKALLYPVLLHGAYDFSTELGLLPFLAVLVFIYVYGMKLLKKASLLDSFITGAAPAPVYSDIPASPAAGPFPTPPAYGKTAEIAPTAAEDLWICPGCGKCVSGKFCSNCGTGRPAAPASDADAWFCGACGTRNTGKFCRECGVPRSAPAAANGARSAAGPASAPEDRFFN